MKKTIKYSMSALLLCTTILNAQENNFIDDITITATQNPELKAHEAPLPVTVVTSADIEEKGITKIQELFDQTSGVDAINAGPGSVMPVIRGLSHEQVLILVNGVRLSDERPGGNHVLSIDPAQIERMEIVKGPGSVLYGAGAVGGVINFITKKASTSQSDTLELSGDIATGYESNNNGKYQKIKINANSKDLNLYFGAVNRDSDNTESPDEEVKFSFYDGYTIWAGGDYTAGKFKTEVNLWQSKADIGITAPKTFISDYYKDETHTMGEAKITYMANGDLLKQFDFQIGLQEHNRHRLREPDATKLVDIEVDKKTKTLRSQFVLEPNEKNRLTLGVDMFKEDLTSTRSLDGYPAVIAQFDDVPVMAPSSRTGIGIFAQDEVDINKEVKLTAGIRYDSIKAETDGSSAPYFITSSHSDKDSALSGSLGVVYQFNNAGNIYANIGRAFRTPTLIERYYHGPHDGPAQDRGNPDLDPEKSFNTDIGVRFKGESYDISSGIFYNKVDNMIRKILINPLEPVESQIYEYQNIADATLYGAELDVKYFISDEWSMFTNIWFTKGKDDTHNTDLSAIAPLKAKYGVDYDTEIFSYETLLGLNGETALRQNDIGIGEKETPSYTLVNFNASIYADNGVKFSLAVDNIFDRTTYNHLSYGWQQLGYASMGRNIKVELGYSF
ncbi:MAG: TonB-dependent receptor [Campylobacterota bacterium]|nr:TonB-dependent receptor [Campylobacterota bacterium]